MLEGREGELYYQVIHNRIVRQIKTGYKVFPREWDACASEFVLPVQDENRKTYVEALKEKVAWDMSRLRRIAAAFERKRMAYSADEVVEAFLHRKEADSLFVFTEKLAFRLQQSGRMRTGETYIAALHSFMRFRNGKDVLLDEVDAELITAYESYLKTENVSMNTISFYMRILRAVYNRAVEKELVEQRHPFKHVYTGIEKTVKRAVPLKIIRRIKELDFTYYPSLDYARDLFLFSFYTRGMSFVDMAFLKKNDLVNGILSYRRKKTGQLLFIKWERCMQEIVDKYPENPSPYLLPIIKQAGSGERLQYKNASALVNRRLKEVGEKAGLSVPLTMYVARHSWASIAKSKNIPVSVISEGMGHDSETTTLIYLTSLDTTVVDKANKLILSEL